MQGAIDRQHGHTAMELAPGHVILHHGLTPIEGFGWHFVGLQVLSNFVAEHGKEGDESFLIGRQGFEVGHGIGQGWFVVERSRQDGSVYQEQ